MNVKRVCAAALGLLALSTFAYTSDSPWIWQGTFAKSMRSKLNINNIVYLLTGSADPTSVAQSAPAGSLYLRTSGAAYVKTDAGSSTNWTALGGGSGGGATITATNHGVVISGSSTAMTATSAGTAGQVITSGGASADPTYKSPPVQVRVTYDGGGSAITTGHKVWASMQAAGTITGWVFLCDQSGSIVVSLKKSTYGNFLSPTNIAASAPPTITTAAKNQDTTLTGWTTSLSAGDVIETEVTSASTVTHCQLFINVSGA